MRKICWLLLPPAALLGLAQERGLVDTSRSPYVKQRSVGLGAVRWTRGFWADRCALVAKVSLPAMWEVMQDAGNSANFVNFKIAAGLQAGKFHGNDWSDGDVYKALEAMALVYSYTHDPKLDETMDQAIAVIAKAQTPEGYIGTHTQLTTKKRWGDLRYHELYNFGHLFTAACVHARVTGKDSFLSVARKAADYVYTVFKPRPRELAHFCFNPSQIMGLVELYRTTGNPKYLDLAGIFVDMRGSQPGGTDQNQTRVPLRKETEAVGHAVTGPYLWAGATDVYAETGEEALRQALERLWRDVVERKMYITGGIAALHQGASIRRDPVHEAFGYPYQLPQRTAYNETCAGIAMAMWSWRMLGVTGDPKYADVVELIFYNTLLSAWGLDGKTYFYTNPLRRYGKEDPLMSNDSWQRWPSTTTPGAPYCYCCPPNVLRTVAGSAAWAYAVSEKNVWVNLYGSNTFAANVPGVGPVRLTQDTNYPWEGHVQLRVESAGAFTLNLRVPGWAEGATVRVNGQPGPAARAGSYVSLSRTWKPGDSVELTLPLHPRLVEAHPKAEELRNQVAVMRGPLVYALESPDLPPGVRISEVFLPAQIKLTPHHEGELLGGVTVLEGEAVRIPEGDWTGLLYRTLLRPTPERIRLRLIPYYAWANRGVSYMTVWLPVLR
jgi:DUF1680 family protein